MSHGPVIQKPINELAKQFRNLIPANIPEGYTVKSMFEDIASQENIRKGVIAYRDFLYLFCDRLISDGDLYFKLQKKPKNDTDYPFVYIITDLLSDIGYHSVLAEDGASLLVTKIPSFTASIDENGNIKKAKNAASMLMECLRFLTICGFNFNGVDLEAKTFSMSEVECITVSYPNNPIMLTGFKVLSIADIELRAKRYSADYNHDDLLRCDYRLIKVEDTDVLEHLKDFIYPLPKDVQKFVLELHQHYIDMGMTCVMYISIFDVHFAYAYIKNSKKELNTREIYQKRIWEFALSTRFDYCIAARPKKTDKYMDVIEKFSLSLQKTIKRGYGCDRLTRGEPCQKGCGGIRIPLDESILEISSEIKTWFDKEVSFLVK